MQTSSQKPSILMVDDNAGFRLTLRHSLSPYFQVEEAGNQQECWAVLRKRPIQMALLDLVLPDVNGFELLQRIGECFPSLPIIVISTLDTIKMATESMRLGAKNYIFKEDLSENSQWLLEVLRQHLIKKSVPSDNNKERPSFEFFESRFIPDLPVYHGIYQRSVLAVKNGLSLLIQGESGTGKDVLTQYIHQAVCPDKPLIAIDSGAICPSLAESELFGYEKGAFTGAEEKRPGKITLAHGGILFLDEIGNMAMDIQHKLLRVLESKTVTPLGGQKSVPIDFLIISATHTDLEKAVQKGEFRQDLYYRLNHVVVKLPSLSETPEVIFFFVEKFVAFFNKKYHKTFPLTDTFLNHCLGRNWQGNIRELRNFIQTTIALSEETEWKDIVFSKENTSQSYSGISFRKRIELFEKETLSQVLRHAHFNVSKAARNLGIPRSTLQHKVEKYNIMGLLHK